MAKPAPSSISVCPRWGAISGNSVTSAAAIALGGGMM